MKVNVLDLNSSTHDGGAALAAQRLHMALLGHEINSAFQAESPDAINQWRPWLGELAVVIAGFAQQFLA